MDFSKLSSNDKLAVVGALAAIVGAVLTFGGVGGGGFGVLTGAAMLVIIFLPQFSPSTKLPGTKGSLMLIVGGVSGISALFALLGLLTVLGAFAFYGGVFFVAVLLSIGGGLLMGWASWQTFQAEGGKFNMGMSSAPSAPPAPPAPTYSPPPPMAPPTQEPMSDSSEDRPQG